MSRCVSQACLRIHSYFSLNPSTVTHSCLVPLDVDRELRREPGYRVESPSVSSMSNALLNTNEEKHSSQAIQQRILDLDYYLSHYWCWAYVCFGSLHSWFANSRFRNSVAIGSVVFTAAAYGGVVLRVFLGEDAFTIYYGDSIHDWLFHCIDFSFVPFSLMLSDSLIFDAIVPVSLV